MSSEIKIDWDMAGIEVERESLRRIETEMGEHRFNADEWPVARRMIHACADFAIADDLVFRNDPITAIRNAVRGGATVYCDSNMIRSGVSVARLSGINPDYTRDSVVCYIADEDVAATAKERGCTRALVALEKAGSVLNGAVVLIGNAPLALAGLIRMVHEEGIRPAAVIAMPVGFVHVVESKQMVLETDLPQIVLNGRRGGSPLAVSAFHGVLEGV